MLGRIVLTVAAYQTGACIASARHQDHTQTPLFHRAHTFVFEMDTTEGKVSQSPPRRHSLNYEQLAAECPVQHLGPRPNSHEGSLFQVSGKRLRRLLIGIATIGGPGSMRFGDAVYMGRFGLQSAPYFYAMMFGSAGRVLPATRFSKPSYPREPGRRRLGIRKRRGAGCVHASGR